MEQEATQASLEQKKQFLAAASQELATLKTTISNDLPREARRAVLLNRLDTEVGHLTRTHESIRRVRSELADLGQPAEIPAAVLAAVEDELRPEYLVRDRISRLKTWLTVVTALAALLSGVLPGYFDRFVLAASGLIILPLLLLLADAQLPGDRRARRTYQQIALLAVLLSGALASLAFGAILMSIGSVASEAADLVPIGGVFLLLSFGASLGAAIIWRRNRVALRTVLRRGRRLGQQGAAAAGAPRHR